MSPLVVLFNAFRPSPTPPGQRRRTGLRLPVVIATSVMIALGCASDGRELAEPQDWQTTTSRPAPPTTAPAQEISESGVTLTSPDFQPGETIPVDATCNGRNVFPNLNWSEIPGDISELAITLSDQSNPEEPVLIWLSAGIVPSESGLAAGFLPNGAFETLNDYGNLGYGSPCINELPAGRHDLQFRLHMLGEPSGVSKGDPGNEAWDTIEAKTLESASLLAFINT